MQFSTTINHFKPSKRGGVEIVFIIAVKEQRNKLDENEKRGKFNEILCLLVS